MSQFSPLLRILSATLFFLFLIVSAQTCSNSPTDNPVPEIASVSPSSLVSGMEATLTIVGTNFVSGVWATWDDVRFPVIRSSEDTLRLALTGEQVGDTRIALLTVENPGPGGGASNSIEIPVIDSSPEPVIQSYSPDSLFVGRDGESILLRGSGFIVSTAATWNGSPRASTTLSQDSLTVTLLPKDMIVTGSGTLRITNPAPGGGAASITLPVAVGNPRPTITALDPSELVLNMPDSVLVIGSGFMESSVVSVLGIVDYRFISESELKVAVPAEDVMKVGEVTLRVFNPAPGGGRAEAPLQVILPKPILTSVMPDTVSPGLADPVLTLTGSGFTEDSEGWAVDEARPTTFVSDTELEVQVENLVLGEAQLWVENPEPGGGASDSLTYLIADIEPELRTLSLAGIPAGQSSGLVLEGSGFSRNSIIQFNGSDNITGFVNFGRLETVVNAEALPWGMKATINVFNPPPAGGTSSSISLNVFDVVEVSASDLVYDASRDKFYGTTSKDLPGDEDFGIAVYSRNGEVEDRFLLSQEPIQLELTDDGQYLYVVTNTKGGSQPRLARLDIDARAYDFDIPMEIGNPPGLWIYASDIATVPGDPQSILVAQELANGNHQGVALFTDGVLVTQTDPGVGGFRLESSDQSGRVYGLGRDFNDLEFIRLQVNPTSILVLDTTKDLFLSEDGDIHYNGGRVYSTDGIVVNAESRTLVADLDLHTHRPSLPENGGLPAFTNDRVFFVLETGSLLAFDKGSLARTDSVGLGDGDYFETQIEALSLGDHALGFFNADANLVLWRDDTVVPEN